MGWFSGSTPSKVSVVTEVKEEKPANESGKFLDDLPPKFDDVEPTHRDNTMMSAVHELKLSDITVERYLSMPCFREAMITGFQAMGVLSGVTFLVRKNLGRSLHWGVGGFFLGNVIGFEQCRSIRRRSFQTVERAKQKNMEKNEKKWKEHNEDDQLEKFQEFNSRK